MMSNTQFAQNTNSVDNDFFSFNSGVTTTKVQNSTEIQLAQAQAPFDIFEACCKPV